MTASPSTHQGKRRRSVSFFTHATGRSTIALQDFTNEEISATWYSRDEYQAIQKSVLREVLRLDEGKIFKDRKFCSLGLEGFTKVGCQTKKSIRLEALQAVLDEQDRQLLDHKMGKIDDVAVSKAYKSVSQRCQLWASAMGLANQREVSTTRVNCTSKGCDIVTKKVGIAPVVEGRCNAAAEFLRRSPIQHTNDSFIHMEKARSA